MVVVYVTFFLKFYYIDRLESYHLFTTYWDAPSGGFAQQKQKEFHHRKNTEFTQPKRGKAFPSSAVFSGFLMVRFVC